VFGFQGLVGCEVQIWELVEHWLGCMGWTGCAGCIAWHAWLLAAGVLLPRCVGVRGANPGAGGELAEMRGTVTRLGCVGWTGCAGCIAWHACLLAADVRLPRYTVGWLSLLLSDSVLEESPESDAALFVSPSKDWLFCLCRMGVGWTGCVGFFFNPIPCVFYSCRNVFAGEKLYVMQGALVQGSRAPHWASILCFFAFPLHFWLQNLNSWTFERTVLHFSRFASSFGSRNARVTFFTSFFVSQSL